MQLKEMENTGVIIGSADEQDEFLGIASSGSWVWNSGQHAHYHNRRNFPFYITACNNMLKGSISYGMGKSKNLITLDQFKKEQGIMKYKKGDVLVDEDGDCKKVLEVIGSLYALSLGDKFNQCGTLYTESELDKIGYTLKTDDPQTELTISQLEEKLNMKSGTLRVKAEE